MQLHELTLTEAKKGLEEKKFSSVELTNACLTHMKQTNAKLHAFLTVTEKEALEAAKHADLQRLNGSTLPLLGIPVAMKDMYVTKDIRTTAGAKVLEDYTPPYDGTVVGKLKDAGAVIVGKTNGDAWAHGSSGENSDFAPAKNPYDLDYIPGGSSSGSAAAVAAGMCPVATGTDTGGSIRLPASFCNVVGLKPAYGQVSRYGVIAMASSVDTIGHFTKTVEDSALFLNVTAGKDPMDSTTIDTKIYDYTSGLEESIKGLKIGIPKEYFIEGVDPRVKDTIEKALKKLEEQGAEIIEISLPHTTYAIAVYYIVQTAEVSSNLARYDGIRYGNNRSLFGDEAKRRIMLGTYVLSAGYYDAYYKKAMRVRTLIKQDFDAAYEKVDVIITPVSPTLPWKLGEKTSDPLKMYLSDIFTVTANLAGLCGLSVPVGFIDGLPVGMQILGRAKETLSMFTVGYQYQQQNPVWKTRPNL